MAGFNHYAKIKRILELHPAGWYIKLIDQPTSARNFKGELVSYDHYYRIFDASHQPIKYCKFQKLDKLAQTLELQIEDLVVVQD